MTQTIFSDVDAGNDVLFRALPVPAGLNTLFYAGSQAGRNMVNLASGPALVNMGPPGILAPTFVTLGQVGVTATAHSVLTGGVVTSMVVDIAGTLYSVVPSCIFTPVSGGSGASATPVVSGGAVVGFTSLVGGAAYGAAPLVNIGGGNFAAINSQVPRLQPVVDGGFTWLCVAAKAVSGGAATIMSDCYTSAANPYGVTMQNIDPLNGNLPTVGLNEVGARRVSLTLPGPATTPRMIALTWNPGTQDFTLYNLTDGTTPATFHDTTVSVGSAYSMHWGPSPLPIGGTQLPGQFNSQFDLYAGMNASNLVGASALADFHDGMAEVLLRRGVVC